MKLWKKGLALLMVLSITAGMVMTGSAEAGLVPIDSASFPDPAFLRWVQEKDTDGDGALSQAEREAVTRMDLRKLGIQDLSYLAWGGSPLAELDLSGNPKLHTLHVLGGDLAQADLSHNT